VVVDADLALGESAQTPATGEVSALQLGAWLRWLLLIGFVTVLALEAWLLWQASRALF
jgi:hypothetical protein